MYITDFCLVISDTDWSDMMQIQLDPSSELQLYNKNDPSLLVQKKIGIG